MRAPARAAILLFCLMQPACEPASETGGLPADQSGPVVLSLLGERLLPLADTTGAVADAESALAANPSDVELVLAAGHARAAIRDYPAAIDHYGRAIALAPNDWRGYRHRGHRFLSTRRLPSALLDLETARELSPRSFDVAYHLGLAYYLSGVARAAADEYARCLALAEDPAALAMESSGSLGDGVRSCMSIATDDNARVAITDWLYRALRRAGRSEEAAELLGSVSQDMSVTTNTAYHHALLFYKGLMSEETLLAQDSAAVYRFETIGYPVAAWHLADGDTARALELLERVAADPHWPGFGRIAAESDLTRLRRTDVR